ncbi:MAG: PEGA domain-containing protein [Polyangiales bacterium]
MPRIGKLLGSILLGSVLVSAGPAPAVAQSARQALEAARTHMEQGQELYGEGRYLEAAEEFLAAYRAKEFSAFLYNAGLAYERYGDPARAADQFQRYLDREPTAPDADEVRARITRLRAEAGTRTGGAGAATAVTETPAGGTGAPTTGTEPSTGTAAATVGEGATQTARTAEVRPAEDMKSLLSVQTQPEGARIVLRQGGTVVAQGPSPFAETLAEGEYDLTVEHPDYRAVEQHVRIRAGKVYVVIIEMSQAQFLGYLRVISDPPGAGVFVDDRSAGANPAPYRVEIPTGTHRIWIERTGFEPIEREVEVGLGEQVEVRVSLERVTYGRVRMIGNVRGAEITVDGQRVGGLPYEGDLPAGVHRIRVTAPDLKTWEHEVRIERGQVTPIRVRLRPAPDRSNAYATLGLSVMSLGAGIGLGVASRNLEDELRHEASAGTLASDDPRFNRGRGFAIGADTALGLAGLFGVLTIYYFVHDPLPDSEGTVLEPRDWTFLPSLDPVRRSASFSIGRRF